MPGADVTDATHLADVASGLGLVVHPCPDQLQVGMVVHGGNGMAADVAGGPLDHAKRHGCGACCSAA